MNPSELESSAQFVQLLTGFQSRLYAYLRTLLVRAEDAREVLQETNLVLWKKCADYDVSRPFGAWALRFAYWQALAWRKRQSRDRLVFDEALVSVLAEEFSGPTSAEGELRALEDCLAKLPAKQRELVEQRYAGEKSVQDIAEAEGKAPNAIAALLYRARKFLADCISATPASREELA